MRRNMRKIVSHKKARTALLVALLGTTAAGVVAQVALENAAGTSGPADAIPAPTPLPVSITDVPEVVVTAEPVEEVTEVAPAPAPVEVKAEPAAPAIDLTESLSMIGRGDIIRRQAIISERKLILDRESQLIEAIQAIVDEIGMEGLNAFYPELAVLVQDSPMALRAQLERAELLADIKALSGEEETEEPTEETAAEAPSAPLQGLMEVTVAPVGASVDDDPLAEMRAREAALAELRNVAATAPEEAEPVPVSFDGDLFRATSDLQLIEIYGLATDLRAVVADGPGVTATLRSGDMLRNATILEVGPSGMTVSIDLDPLDETDAPVEGKVTIRR